VLYLIVRYWGQTTGRLGGDLGLLWAAALGVGFSFDSESRHLLQFFVVYAVFAVAACDRDGLWPKLLLPFLLGLVFFSKFWLPSNWPVDWMQMYMGHQGPFMGHGAYCIHAACLVAAGLGMLGWLWYGAAERGKEETLPELVAQRARAA
jgi:hypothetical protein